jgi:hypothetical protein
MFPAFFKYCGRLRKFSAQEDHAPQADETPVGVQMHDGNGALSKNS